MLLYYIRHGDPVYNPDSLTLLGKEQAMALSKRLCRYGVDEIYSSSSQRAIDTVTPTAELLKKEIVTLDWCNEKYAWEEFTMNHEEEGTKWLFSTWQSMRAMCNPEVAALGFEWYKHPYFTNGEKHKDGIERITKEARAFLAEQGFEFSEKDGCYRFTKPNGKRIALVAHEGFGSAFIPVILNIPYPYFAGHFCLGHSSLTVIEFPETDTCVPRILTYSNDAHIYGENLPTKFHNRLYY